ncbi:MAG: hypothetical protein EOP48_04955, partial [Sphingobacteriales bacterium]
MSLRVITYQDIDKQAWDNCILNSPNGLIYSTSAYLDAMCPRWNAIVLNNYEAVMPLPWRKKWNIPYLYQPAFIQQGGVISPHPVDESLTKLFINLAASHYRYAAITLNFNNPVSEKLTGNISVRNNFIIHLATAQPAFGHKGDYFPKRFRRASKNGLIYSADHDYKSAIKLYRKLYGSRLSAFKPQDYQNFEKICKGFSAEGKVMIRKVQHEKETIAVVLLLLYKNRWY